MSTGITGTPAAILVTGASGFVGRGLVPYLAAQGVGGVATGRTAPAGLMGGWIGATRTGVLAGAEAPGPIEAVVHLEVRQHVPRPRPSDAADFERVNVGNTREWLDWAGRAGVGKFIFLSSIKAVAASPEPRFEDAPPTGADPYGRSKAAAERLVQEWALAQPGRSAVILRAAPVYGPGNEANLAAFARQVVRGRPCLVGNGGTLKSIVSRTNLVAAVLFSARIATPGYQIFNVTDRETRSMAEIAALISRISAAPAPKAIPSAIAGLIARLGDLGEAFTGRSFPLTTPRLRAMHETTVFPCDKLAAAGFSHPQTTEQGLAEMVQPLLAAGQ